MSHLLLSLYFGLFASGNHKDLSNTVLRQLSVLSESCPSKKTLDLPEHHMPLLSIKDLGSVFHFVFKQGIPLTPTKPVF